MSQSVWKFIKGFLGFLALGAFFVVPVGFRMRSVGDKYIGQKLQV